MSEVLLEVDRLQHYYGAGVAVREVTFAVQAGEFVSIVGPSGCGKTTTLKAIAGLVSPSSGDVRIDGRSILADPPRNRPCSLVFQSLALFPHMTVAENLAFPLKSLGVERSRRGERIREMCQLVGLGESLADRRPAQLSGGQMQRVALARSLIYNPRLLLLDEPLSAIDFQLRQQLRKMLSDLHRRIGKTFLYVTHSLEEALSLSDRVIVMSDGEILQIGTPSEIYGRPTSRVVGEFMGDANVMSVTRAAGENLYESGELGCTVHIKENSDLAAGCFLLRAHEINLGQENLLENAVSAEIFNRYDLGSSIEYSLVLQSTGFHLNCRMEKAAAQYVPGDNVNAYWPADAGIVVPAG